MKEKFTPTVCVLTDLMRSDAESFFEKYPQKYYLNCLTWDLFFALYGLRMDSDLAQKLLLDSDFETEAEFRTVLKYLYSKFSVEYINNILIKHQRFDLLVLSNQLEEFCRLYPREICLTYKKAGKINKWCKNLLLLEECEDWKTLADYDQVEILVKHKCQDVMLKYGGDKCLDFLLLQGYAKDIFRQIEQEDYCNRERYARCLIRHNEWLLLSRDADLHKHVRIDDLGGFLFSVICYRESNGERDNKKLLCTFFSGSYYKRWLKRENEAELIWLYHRAEEVHEYDRQKARQRIKSLYAWYDFSGTSRLVSEEWSGSLAAVRKKLAEL